MSSHPEEPVNPESLSPGSEPETPRPPERVFEDWGLEVNAYVHRHEERIAVLEQQVAALRDAQVSTDALLQDLLRELRERGLR
jgi:hypothetical protein